MTAAANAPLPEDVCAALIRIGLVDDGAAIVAEPLSGGVSSDIWKVTTPRRTFCVKRALAKLKVAQDWRAPVERSAYEAKWIATARTFVPQAAPEIFGYDETAGVLALAWYDPAHYKLWKAELRDGRVAIRVAEQVGAALAKIHSGTAGSDRCAADFATDTIFHAIRLEPYLLGAGREHPELSARLQWLVERTASTKRALVHGDVSPKNILVGPTGPLLLDAECAWYGDPAFDVAFCLNHLLLKCLWAPSAVVALLAAYDALAESYLAAQTVEPRAELEARAAHLLPGLFLARIDGKSPVEYITRERDKDRIRLVARLFLLKPAETLAEIRAMWAEELRP
jgi:aminoglycoside phosphotransferase (APT) family kinase protein